MASQREVKTQAKVQAGLGGRPPAPQQEGGVAPDSPGVIGPPRPPAPPAVLPATSWAEPGVSQHRLPERARGRWGQRLSRSARAPWPAGNNLGGVMGLGRRGGLCPAPTRLPGRACLSVLRALRPAWAWCSTDRALPSRVKSSRPAGRVRPGSPPPEPQMKCDSVPSREPGLQSGRPTPGAHAFLPQLASTGAGGAEHRHPPRPGS